MARSVQSVRLAAALAASALAGALPAALPASSAPRAGGFAGVLAPPQVPPYPSAYLACLDRDMLGSKSARLEIPEFHDAFSLSPDGKRVALGLSKNADPTIDGPGTGRVGLQIVDLTRMEPVRDVHTGIAAEAVAWLSQTRVAALLQNGLVVADPNSGAVVSRWAGWSGPGDSAARTHAHFVVVHPGQGGARIGSVDRRAHLRVARLWRVRGGEPRLLADPERERAVVVGEGGSAAEVDLRTMRVRYRTLRAVSRSTPPRAFHAKSPDAPQPSRVAQWIGQGMGAVLGKVRGVTLVDTVRWRAWKVDRSARALAFAGRLIAYGPTGVRGYTLDGRKVFDLLGGQRILSVATVPGRAYVLGPSALYVLDPLTGRATRSAGTPPSALMPVAIRCPS